MKGLKDGMQDAINVRLISIKLGVRSVSVYSRYRMLR